VGEAVIVAGIGCRKGATADEIEAAIAAALERSGARAKKLRLIATAARKRDEAGIAQAASARGLQLVFVDDTDLETATARGATWSRRVLALAGVPSVAEAAALHACGPTSRLLLSRVTVGPVTCALATPEETP
jgi:cobalt-precorrin 5A hydrolase